jgi:hypothetical protein
VLVFPSFLRVKDHLGKSEDTAKLISATTNQDIVPMQNSLTERPELGPKSSKKEGLLPPRIIQLHLQCFTEFNFD